MKVAYLIIAHDQPEHLHRLVHALDADWAHCFVHVDAKRDIGPFQEGLDSPRVHFLDDRVSVQHSGFSLTRSMIRLLKSAAAQGDFDYYQFLSGSDYPIKPLSQIYHHLTEGWPQNYINFYPLIEGANLARNIQKFYFMDFIRARRQPVKGLLSIGQRGLHAVTPRRRFVPGFTPYRGSQWFCLNRDTVRWVLAFLDSSQCKRYCRFFKYAKASDEIFFHTLVLNSPFAPQCRFYQRDVVEAAVPLKNENKAYLHYVDWDPSRPRKTLLGLADLPALKATEALYARKFDAGYSADLLDAIDAALLG